MKSVLFICTHNSARSQIAEALCNHYFGNIFKASSAGTEKTFVKPQAIQALKSIGIDASTQFSKTVFDLPEKQYDIVVSVCDSASETCPIFPGKTVLHKSFSDPSNCPDETKLECFKATVTEIYEWLKTFAKQYQ